MSRRTSIEVDDALLQAAQDALGTTGLKDTVERAFERAIRSHRRRSLLDRLERSDGLDRTALDDASAPPTGAGGMLLADTSVWHRSDHPAIFDDRRRLLHRGDIALPSDSARVLYSAGGADDHHQLSWELDGLIDLPCEGRHFERALEVQAALADAEVFTNEASSWPIFSSPQWRSPQASASGTTTRTTSASPPSPARRPRGPHPEAHSDGQGD